jgi:hypothetical protein
MISVSAVDVQKNIDEFGRRANAEPIEVKHDNRSKSYLISEKLFRDLMSSYRRALPVEDLTDEDVALIERAQVMTEEPYNLDDIPEIDQSSTLSR